MYEGGLTSSPRGRTFAPNERWPGALEAVGTHLGPAAVFVFGGRVAGEVAAVQKVLEGIDWLLATLDVRFGSVELHVVNDHVSKIVPRPSYTPDELLAVVAQRGAP
jgi:hypothetical protein